ncbi:hypothetical protein LIZ87_01895 [Lacrimispora sp. 210928-DFI.3.58]|nr:hypothetical protein [Lacrimispora sp. 210928-DFI.3.58]
MIKARRIRDDAAGKIFSFYHLNDPGRILRQYMKKIRLDNPEIIVRDERILKLDTILIVDFI